MRKPKREDTDGGRGGGRVRAVALAAGALVIWCVMYAPLGGRPPEPLPEALGWMAAQRNLARYVRPGNDTAVLAPSPAGRCEGGGPLLAAVVVCSAVAHFEARRAIRSTWASEASTKLNNMQVFFLLGLSTNATLNAQVSEEHSLHGDIIQEDFLDTYNNLTLKTAFLLKWGVSRCSPARFIMKTDDDMFVHLPNLGRILHKAKGEKAERLLAGCLIRGAVPVKDHRSKWFAPDAAFPGRVYPDYLSGTGYVMGRSAARDIFAAAMRTPFFFLEDVFVTGVCAAKAGVKPLNHEGFKFYKRKNDGCTFRTLITAHRMTPKELEKMWTAVKDPSLKCKKAG